MDAVTLIMTCRSKTELETISEFGKERRRWTCDYSSLELGYIGRVIVEDFGENLSKVTYKPTSEDVTSKAVEVSLASHYQGYNMPFSSQRYYDWAAAERLKWIKRERLKVWKELVGAFSDRIDSNPILKHITFDYDAEAKEESIPEIPKRGYYRNRWREIWLRVKPYHEQGLSYAQIDGLLAKSSINDNYRCARETMSKIIRAGAAGKLD